MPKPETESKLKASSLTNCFYLTITAHCLSINYGEVVVLGENHKINH
jgi:hypothetical protein